MDLSKDLNRYRGRRVLVNMVGGELAFDGTLEAAGRDSITLENATALQHGVAEGAPVDGELIVPTTRIDWLQVP